MALSFGDVTVRNYLYTEWVEAELCGCGCEGDDGVVKDAHVLVCFENKSEREFYNVTWREYDNRREPESDNE